MTKIVPIDQDLKKEDPPEADQKLIGAMVEMLSGLDQRLNKYFEDSETKNLEPDKKTNTKAAAERSEKPKTKP